MACEDTLKIKNLPQELTDGEKADFLRHFGAVQVKVITAKAKERSTAYAMFRSTTIAKNVMLRLHQAVVLNNRLCVEYAEQDLSQRLPLTKQIENVQSTKKKNAKTFITKLNSFNYATSFHQPAPPHLRYNYPKPNRATISNIAHALASVPKFYTQVLHLMNKMNLPPPFSNVPDPPPVIRPSDLQHPPPLLANPFQPVPGGILHHNKNQFNGPDHRERSSSESEVGSDNEGEKFKEIIPAKRPLPQKHVIKRPKFIRPNIAQPIVTHRQPEKITDIFENIEIQPVRKIQFNVSSECLQQVVQQKKVAETPPVGINPEPPEERAAEICINPEPPEEAPAEVEEKTEEEQKPSVITLEELAANRIEPKDFGVLPVFNNYHPGNPTSRLYIKNISKTACLEDLEFIYKRYIDNDKAPGNCSEFDIRHMTEGRMKGQAFITLDNVELAQEAVKDTNGYMLKDKPLVVVFARSKK